MKASSSIILSGIDLDDKIQLVLLFSGDAVDGHIIFGSISSLLFMIKLEHLEKS